MKPETKIPTAGSEALRSHPPPVVHPSTEPEYDTEQLARRASKVTDVLEHILQEHPAAVGGTFEPPRPPAAPPG